MIKRIKMLLPLTLLVVLAVSISGCSAGAAQQVTAQNVIDKMRETAKTTQTSQGTVDILVNINKQGIKTLVQGMMPMMGGKNGKGGDQVGQGIDRLPDTASATLKVWRQSPDKGRIEVDKSSIPNTSGDVLIYDGQKVYGLDKAHNTVYMGTPDKMMQAKGGQMMPMMQSADVEKEIDKVLAAADIKMAGSEKVAGIDAYKLDVTPKANAAELLDLPKQFQMQAGVLLKDGKATLWVDKTRWIPLKFTVEHPNIGQLTYTASNVELNKPIDASQFVLQIPAGAKTVDLDVMHQNMQPKSMTIQQARDAATKDGWKLLEPTYLSDKATLVDVSTMPNMGRMGKMGGSTVYMLNYSSPNTDFSVAQAQSEMGKQLGDDFSGMNSTNSGATKEVTVRGVKAMAFSPPGGNSNWTALMWKEKDSNVWVAIRGKITVDEAVKIAEGLK